MSNATIKNCEFSYFNTTESGTIYFEVGSILNIINTRFLNSLGVGNAISGYTFSWLFIDSCSFFNINGYQGGAISLIYGGSTYIYNSFFVNNTAFVDGGAI